jgi:2-polyprenyl-3-methyl-5-hydroxy-6-metoxy-1,4-benzoquinol methylase
LHRWLEWSGLQFDFASIEGEDAGWGRFYSCNVSLKRDFFLDAGGFDEDFTYDYEDLDLGYRLNEKALRLLYERDALVRHLHPYDWQRVAKRWASHATGERTMVSKHSWFSPFFGDRVRWASEQPRVSRAWTVLADIVPPSAGRIHRVARARAERWYQQQLAGPYQRAWDADAELEDLKAYLGPAYDHAKLVEHQDTVDREHDEIGDEERFYRTSEGYLYDLTAFAMSGTKGPYLRVLKSLVPPGGRLLDYGCGIGSDGLKLIDAGYHVDFADFDNPSTRYLRWRLARRAYDANIFDIDRDVITGGYDAVFSFDVIEHIDDPFAFLKRLEQLARIVVVNFLEPDPDDTHLHRPLPIEQLVKHAARNGLLHYRKYHGRSHLVAYRSTPANSFDRLRSTALLLRQRLR